MRKIIMGFALVMILSFPVYATREEKALRDAADRLETQAQELEKSAQEVRKELQDLEKQEAALSKQLRELEASAMENQATLEILQEQIEMLKERIQETQAAIQQAKADLEAQRAAFGKRLSAMYRQADVGYMEVLFGSNNIADMLSRMTLMQVVARADRIQMSDLRTAHERLEEEERTLAAQVESLEVAERAAQDKIEALAAQAAEKEALMANVQDELAFSEDEIARLKAQSSAQKSEAELKRKRAQQLESDRLAKEKAEREKAERERAAAEKEAQEKAEREKRAEKKQSTSSKPNQSAVATGVLIWPVPSSYRVTSDFGERIHPVTGQPSFHGGIDIGAASGASIEASDGGTVIWADYKGTYGNCVMIDHGNGLVTLYAHASSFAVSKGDKVSQGQTIAYVGSTGRSTGPHLHFEVRKEGSRVSPWNYL